MRLRVAVVNRQSLVTVRWSSVVTLNNHRCNDNQCAAKSTHVNWVTQVPSSFLPYEYRNDSFIANPCKFKALLKRRYIHTTYNAYKRISIVEKTSIVIWLCSVVYSENLRGLFPGMRGVCHTTYYFYNIAHSMFDTYFDTILFKNISEHKCVYLI